MGQTTKNISLYIPAAGETNYAQAFAAGMINLDNHDHTGGPTNGVQITNSGLADQSVTYQKLNTNVADATTGIQAGAGTNKNQLQILGLLQNIFKIPFGTNGFISKNGNAATARTFTFNANQLTITDPDGIAAAPNFSLASTVLNPTQPAFYASAVTGGGAQVIPVATDTVLQFPNESFDQSNNYDNTTFTFTAPKNGVYLIGTRLSISNIIIDGNFQFSIFVNGASNTTLHRLNAFPIQRTGTYTFSANQILQLSAGDLVTIHANIDMGVGNPATLAAGTFTGALLF